MSHDEITQTGVIAQCAEELSRTEAALLELQQLTEPISASLTTERKSQLQSLDRLTQTVAFISEVLSIVAEDELRSTNGLQAALSTLRPVHMRDRILGRAPQTLPTDIELF